MFEQLPLKDIHLPDPVSWWPPAIGWWLAPIILILLVLLLRMAAKAVLRVQYGRRVRAQALRELALIEREFDTNRDAGGAMQRISILLRRVAITAYPHRTLAGCAGEAWVDWLRRTGPEEQDAEILDALTRAPYQSSPEIQMQHVLQSVKGWIIHATKGYHSPGQPS